VLTVECREVDGSGGRLVDRSEAIGDLGRDFVIREVVSAKVLSGHGATEPRTRLFSR
jgi:hypothetical protein